MSSQKMIVSTLLIGALLGALVFSIGFSTKLRNPEVSNTHINQIVYQNRPKEFGEFSCQISMFQNNNYKSKKLIMLTRSIQNIVINRKKSIINNSSFIYFDQKDIYTKLLISFFGYSKEDVYLITEDANKRFNNDIEIINANLFLSNCVTQIEGNKS